MTPIAASSRCSATSFSTSQEEVRAHLRRRQEAREGQVRLRLQPEALQEIIAEYKKLVKKETGKDFPQGPLDQLVQARDAVFGAGRTTAPRPIAASTTSTTGWAQRSTCRPWSSATWAKLRHRRRLHAQSRHRRACLLRRVPDERAGRRRRLRRPHAAAHQRARKAMPKVYEQLRDITWKMEKHYRDMQDFEFTIQDGKLYMLQTRNGKRTGLAAVRVAIDMVAKASSRRKKPSSASSPTSFTTSWFRASLKRARRSKSSPPACRRRPARPSDRSSSPPRTPSKATPTAPSNPSSWSAAKPRRKTSPAWKSPPAFSPRAAA
jgi:hypothetical protein